MRKKGHLSILLALSMACAVHSPAQTTQGLITGRVTDLSNDAGIKDCKVAVTTRAFESRILRYTSETGDYAIAPLSPGSYGLRVECANYQSQESHNIRLEVAALVLINIRMRPLSEVWEDNYRKLMLLPDASVLTLYGPDVDLSHTSLVQSLRGAPAALEATVSQTIDNGLLESVPLSGRDAYTLLVLQPGITSDSGTTRSLALSVNGQRASASKFLLDGIENDNSLVTGPLSPIPPEALAEFRISSNSFSAEYGRSSGYISNAVTRAGTPVFHGLAYAYLRNEALVAKAPIIPGGDASAPLREIEPGLIVSGPLRKKWNLTGSFSWESTRLYTRQPPRNFTLPTRSWIEGLQPGTLASKWFRSLSAAAPDAPGSILTTNIAAPLHIDRDIFVPRLDWTNPQGTQRLTARYAGFLVDRPDFVYNPWPGFNTDLSESTHSLVASWIWTPGARLAQELRAGFSEDALSDLRPRAGVPLLSITSSAALPLGVNLPSSNQSSSFSNRTRAFELDENFGYYSARHVLRAGGGLITHRISGVLTDQDTARFNFSNLGAFAADSPNLIQVALDRNDPVTAALPSFNRRYSTTDWYAFVQDSYRPWQRLTLDLGLRYDWFGAPVNIGANPDDLLSLPETGDVATRTQGAVLNRPSGSRPLYAIRHNGLAVRSGLAYSLDRLGKTVIRAAAGVYTDRPFDNLWQTIRNNDYLPLLSPLTAAPRNYADIVSVLQSLPSLQLRATSNDLTTFSTRFSTPRVLNWMAGIQRSLGTRLLFEGDYLGSSSSSLVTTDRYNRQYSVPSTPTNAGGRFAPNLGDILFRANQGSSQYSAFTALVRYRSRRLTSALSYTFSSSWDNQSDPVAGDFFDLGLGGGGLSPEATFIRAGDPSTSWGHSDFDRRHNFVALASWALPGWLEGFQLSFLGALRSGSPFTVFGTPAQVSDLLYNPADLVPGTSIRASRTPVPGGVLLLNSAAFVAVSDHIGSSGRNRLYGPGLVSGDAAISRRFRIPALPERLSFVVRVDAYNVFNHANLGNPDPDLNHGPAFGVSIRGVQTIPQAFRILAPLDDARRQLQLSLKVEF